MTDKETVLHLRQWVKENREHRKDLFAWPTDACGYDQHIKFVKYRNKYWFDLAQDADFDQFILEYADKLERGKELK